MLLIDDDKNFNKALSDHLKSEGYDVHSACSYSEGLTLINQKFDLIVLDWMLTDGQGIDLLKEVRLKGRTVPIIFLTARVDLVDKVLGLEMGANDYITKPFELREFLARVRVQLRRDNVNVDKGLNLNLPLSKIVIGELTIDSLKHEVHFQNRKMEFTKKEFDLIKLLADSPNKVFSRDEILNKVWGYDIYPTTRTVDTHVLQIRQKTKENPIETVRNVGYLLRN